MCLFLFSGFVGLVVHDPIESHMNVFYVFLSKYQSNCVFLRLKLGRSPFRFIRTQLGISDFLHGFKQPFLAIIDAELGLVLLHVLPNLLLLLDDLLLVSLKLVDDQSHQLLLLRLQLELLQLVCLLLLQQFCLPLRLVRLLSVLELSLECKFFLFLSRQFCVEALTLVCEVEILLRLLFTGALEGLLQDCLSLLLVEDIEHDSVHEDA